MATVSSGATGSVSFYDGSVFLGQASVTGGVATLSVTTLNVGVHTITATYNGDATYASSASGPSDGDGGEEYRSGFRADRDGLRRKP